MSVPHDSRGNENKKECDGVMSYSFRKKCRRFQIIAFSNTWVFILLLFFLRNEESHFEKQRSELEIVANLENLALLQCQCFLRKSV